MQRQIEGSQAIAQIVAMCRPGVVCAYPISPQTHIIEALGAMVKKGELEHCEYINVDSEMAAMSVAIGASAVGARAFTATSSQGLLYMIEAVYNAAGLGLPVVMTLANRAIGAPINIWNDHSDSMALRDSGWIQLYARDNQEAADLHIQAFRLAEELSQPVMVCMDGFVLTHAFEPVDVPAQELVDEYLPPYEPRQVLDPDDPVSIGALVGPEAFTEVRYLADRRLLQALDLIPSLQSEFSRLFGRDSGGLVRPYRLEGAKTVVLALGSVLGTVSDVVDELRDRGIAIGALGVTTFRPFPQAALRNALEGVERVVVIEKAFAPGAGGIVSADVRLALNGTPTDCHTVVAGLGGRPITASSLRALFESAVAGDLEQYTFLDLQTEVVDRELRRLSMARRSGPSAENILRDLAVVSGPLD